MLLKQLFYFSANLVSFVLGISLTWSSPVISKLNGEVITDDNPIGRYITKDEESWIGSLLTLGGGCGPYLSGFMSDLIGRKKTLLFCSGVPFFISFLILAFAENLVLYYIARFMGGLALGSVFCVLPNYVSEVSESHNRGSLGTSMNIFLTFGLFFSYVVGPFVTIMAFSLICAIFPAIFVILFSFFPESPYYLVRKKQFDEAEKSLRKLRLGTKEDIKRELEEIRDTVEQALTNQGNFLDIFRSRGLIKALTISLSLVLFQQFSGINVVLFYTQTIFEATGSTLSSALSSIIIGGAQLIPSTITPFVADTAGRRPTLLFSCFGMIISEAPLGLYFYLQSQGQDVSSIFWLPVACLVVYIISFRVGFGPLPWTIMSELFPANVKAAACTATSSFCYLLAFFITRYFQNVTVYIGMGGGFWLFTGFCVLSAIFIWFYLPETKKKSFQEINAILNGKK